MQSSVAGGDNKITLGASNLPKHYHDKGNMNIWGQFEADRFGCGGSPYGAGAFEGYLQTKTSTRLGANYDSNYAPVGFYFNANRNWTGRSGGGHTAQTDGEEINATPLDITNNLKKIILHIFVRTN